VIRQASVADLETIAALQAAAPEASRWNPADYLEHTCWITDGAFIVTRETAPGESEVLNLAVAPAQRRKGLARALLQHAFEHAPGAWFLEVRASNAAAIGLYEACGFRVVGRRPKYYNAPPEEGIVMHRGA
jgi:ribosomal-protein-alanine N-acetyltransferase